MPSHHLFAYLHKLIEKEYENHTIQMPVGELQVTVCHLINDYSHCRQHSRLPKNLQKQIPCIILTLSIQRAVRLFIVSVSVSDRHVANKWAPLISIVTPSATKHQRKNRERKRNRSLVQILLWRISCFMKSNAGSNRTKHSKCICMDLIKKTETRHSLSQIWFLQPVTCVKP